MMLMPRTYQSCNTSHAGGTYDDANMKKNLPEIGDIASFLIRMIQLLAKNTAFTSSSVNVNRMPAKCSHSVPSIF